MIEDEIEALYPEFDKWVHEKFTSFGDGLSTIKLWYRFLEEKGLVDGVR